MEGLSMTTINDSQNIFTTVITKLGEIYGLPRTDETEIKALLERLEGAVQDLERIYDSHSVQANITSVERATIIGEICLYVKDSLLHGRWSDWATKNFTEGLRTLEKFMAIARSGLWRANAHLGSEKVYQLTRVEHLLGNNVTLSDLFQDCGLDDSLQNYTGKKLEHAVSVILNKEALREQGIELPNEALHKLTESFSLIRDNINVLGRLCEARSEDANLEKVVTNIISSGGKGSAKKHAVAKNLKEDVNQVAARFIESLQEAIAKPDTRVDRDRLLFVLKLVTECLEVRCPRQ
jgi:hypothetical protein